MVVKNGQPSHAVCFVVDAQLPRRLAQALRAAGHETWHTLDLPRGNATTDQALSDFADARSAILVSKDADFVRSSILQGSPRRLLVISTGNIDNDTPIALVRENLSAITDALAEPRRVELSRDFLLIHSS